MRKIQVVLVMIVLAAASSVQAGQIFEVSVSINTAQISTTDYDYLDELELLIKEYLEMNSWTEDRFEEMERIRVNIQVIINSAEGRRFQATMLLSTERPIFNTVQVTPLLLINDTNWSFELSRSQTLLHDPFQYHDIASVLDYYANLILGFDYDSYSELGGNDYFRAALRIAEMGQTSGSGWTSTGTRRSRHDLVTQLLNPNYEDYRKAIYRYHRHGLDLFTQDPQTARDNILEAFELIHQSQRMTTARYPFELLFTAKHREFRAVFMEADTERRLDAYNILVTIDDSRISEYERLQQ